MSGCNIRGVNFLDIEKRRRCVVCKEVCLRKSTMMKQFCKCGCDAATYCCMECPTIEAYKYFPACKRVEEIKKEEKKLNNRTIREKRENRKYVY